MTRHLRHRSSARLLAGGALVGGLLGASAAWACTPQAYSTTVVGNTTVEPGTDVTVKGFTYTHDIINKDQNNVGRADLDLLVAAGAAEPVKVEIREGMTADEARVGRVVPARQMPSRVETTALSGPDFTAELTLTTPGFHYFYTFAVNLQGELVRPQPLVFEVRTASSRTEEEVIVTPPTGQEGAPIVTPPVNSGTPVVTPAGTPQPAPSPAAAAPAGVTAPARGSSATGTAAAPAPKPAAVSASPAAAGTAAAAAAGDVPAPPPAPLTSDLWSGLSSSGAASLLEGSSTMPPRGGVPIGAGLLGIGVLALAGAAAVAGERRLALARRSRS